MKKRLIAAGLMITLLCSSVLAGCADSQNQNDELRKVEQVGQIPEAFRQIVADNLFDGVTAFDERLLKAETITADRENRVATHRVWMMDLYGKTLATYSCDSDDAYHVDTLTATQDGGFLFVLGFSDYAYDPDTWASDEGFASWVIKCDKDGKCQFDTAFSGLEGMALRYCFEMNGNFYFFGTAQTPETKTRGVGSATDIYMAVVGENGMVLKSQYIAGSDFDRLDAVQMVEDHFVLAIEAQSDDGDFAGSGSNGYPVEWVFTVDEDLEIIEQKKESGEAFSERRLGEKDTAVVYANDALLEGFDAGTPEAFIDYDDFYLIISRNCTGIYDNTPLVISSVWYYTETVYSAYDDHGELLFRASVDSTPDYDAIIAELTADAV